MAGSRLFFPGVPTTMDVNRLMELDVQPGTIVSYEQVTAVIGISNSVHRFRTVTNAWRRRLFRERLLQSSAEGGAFHFLTADAAHQKGRGGLTRVGRASGRLRTAVAAVDSAALTTPELVSRHNLLRRETEAIHEAAQKSARALAAPLPVNGSTLRLAKK
jgi:hypothetical protein